MQDFVALSMVALAAAYLGRVGWQRFLRNRSSACGSCGSSSSNQKPLVQIQMTHAEVQRALGRE